MIRRQKEGTCYRYRNCSIGAKSP